MSQSVHSRTVPFISPLWTPVDMSQFCCDILSQSGAVTVSHVPGLSLYMSHFPTCSHLGNLGSPAGKAGNMIVPQMSLLILQSIKMRLSNVTYDLISHSHLTCPVSHQSWGQPSRTCMHGAVHYCQPLWTPPAQHPHCPPIPTVLFPIKIHPITTTFHSSTAQDGPGAGPWHLPPLRPKYEIPLVSFRANALYPLILSARRPLPLWTRRQRSRPSKASRCDAVVPVEISRRRDSAAPRGSSPQQGRR